MSSGLSKLSEEECEFFCDACEPSDSSFFSSLIISKGYSLEFLAYWSIFGDFR